jgi:hypothetical protein
MREYVSFSTYLSIVTFTYTIPNERKYPKGTYSFIEHGVPVAGGQATTLRPTGGDYIMVTPSSVSLLVKVLVLAKVRVKGKVPVLAREKTSESGSMLAKGLGSQELGSQELGSQELGSQELVQKAGEDFPAHSP